VRSIYEVLSGEGGPSRLPGPVHRWARPPERGPYLHIRVLKHPLFWFAVLVLGLLMVPASSSSFLNPPQCPSYASRMPDGSPCIIGANIGAGLVWLAGIAVAVVGAIGLLVSSGAVLWRRRSRPEPGCAFLGRSGASSNPPSSS